MRDTSQNEGARSSRGWFNILKFLRTEDSALQSTLIIRDRAGVVNSRPDPYGAGRCVVIAMKQRVDHNGVPRHVEPR